MRKILSVILILMALFSLSSCKKEEKAEENTKQEEENISFEAEKNEETEEIVEEIYAKTPEEAADMCMSALYTGDFSGAKHYVLQGGNAFEEIRKFRDKTMKSANAISNGVSKEKGDRLIQNTFNNITCNRAGTEKNGQEATISYTISIPNMGGINFSSYMDGYISSLGMTAEQFMTKLEGMTKEESEKWSNEMGIDILNYVFESGSDFPKTTSSATVTVKNSKNGWIVSQIKIL